MDVRTRLPVVAQAQLTSLLDQVEAASKSLERTGAMAEMLAEARSVETDLLATIPGVDSLLAVTILACVGDIERFPTPDSLANYAGMVPSVHSSGKKQRHGRITKKGSRMLRWAVTQAVQHLKNVPGPFRNLYRRLRRGGKEGRAVVACGRKLLVVIWHMLRNGEAFRGCDPEKQERKNSRRQNRREKALNNLRDSNLQHRQAIVSNLALLRELALRKSSTTPIPEQLRQHLHNTAHADHLLRLITGKHAPVPR